MYQKICHWALVVLVFALSTAVVWGQAAAPSQGDQIVSKWSSQVQMWKEGRIDISLIPTDEKSKALFQGADFSLDMKWHRPYLATNMEVKRKDRPGRVRVEIAHFQDKGLYTSSRGGEFVHTPLVAGSKNAKQLMSSNPIFLFGEVFFFPQNFADIAGGVTLEKKGKVAGHPSWILKTKWGTVALHQKYLIPVQVEVKRGNRGFQLTLEKLEWKGTKPVYLQYKLLEINRRGPRLSLGIKFQWVKVPATSVKLDLTKVLVRDSERADVAELRKQLAKNPNDVGLLYSLYIAIRWKREVAGQKKLELLAKILKLRPQVVRLYQLYLNQLNESKGVEEAEKQIPSLLAKAEKNNVKLSEGFYTLAGRIYEKRNHEEKALAVLEKGWQQTGESNLYFAAVRIGLASSDKDRQKKALGRIENLLGGKWTKAHTLSLKRALQGKLSKSVLAQVIASMEKHKKGRGGTYLELLGNLYLKTGDKKKAAQYLANSVNNPNASPREKYNAARQMYRAGENEKALQIAWEVIKTKDLRRDYYQEEAIQLVLEITLSTKKNKDIVVFLKDVEPYRHSVDLRRLNQRLKREVSREDFRSLMKTLSGVKDKNGLHHFLLGKDYDNPDHFARWKHLFEASFAFKKRNFDYDISRLERIILRAGKDQDKKMLSYLEKALQRKSSTSVKRFLLTRVVHFNLALGKKQEAVKYLKLLAKIPFQGGEKKRYDYYREQLELAQLTFRHQLVKECEGIVLPMVEEMKKDGVKKWERGIGKAQLILAGIEIQKGNVDGAVKKMADVESSMSGRITYSLLSKLFESKGKEISKSEKEMAKRFREFLDKLKEKAEKKPYKYGRFYAYLVQDEYQYRDEALIWFTRALNVNSENQNCVNRFFTFLRRYYPTRKANKGKLLTALQGAEKWAPKTRDLDYAQMALARAYSRLGGKKKAAQWLKKIYQRALKKKDKNLLYNVMAHSMDLGVDKFSIKVGQAYIKMADPSRDRYRIGRVKRSLFKVMARSGNMSFIAQNVVAVLAKSTYPTSDATSVIRKLANNRKGWKKRLDKFATAVKQVKVDQQTTPVVHLYLAEIYRYKSDQKTAAKHYLLGLSQHPSLVENSSYFSRAVGYIFLYANSKEERKELEKILEKTEARLKQVKPVSKTKQGMTSEEIANYKGELYYVKGRYHLKLKQLDKGAEFLEKSLKYIPKDYHKLKVASLLIGAKKHQKAKKVLEDVITSSRSFYNRRRARDMVVEMYTRSKDYPGLTQFMLQLMAKSKSYTPSASRFMRKVYYKDHSKMIGAWEKALVKSPSIDGQFFLAEMYLYKRKYTQGLAVLKRGRGKKLTSQQQARLLSIWRYCVSNSLSHSKYKGDRKWLEKRLEEGKSLLLKHPKDPNLHKTQAQLFSSIDLGGEAIPHLKWLEKYYLNKKYPHVYDLMNVVRYYLDAKAPKNAKALVHQLLTKVKLSSYQRRKVENLKREVEYLTGGMDQIAQKYLAVLQKKGYKSRDLNQILYKARGYKRDKELVGELERRARELAKKKKLKSSSQVYLSLYYYFRYKNRKRSEAYRAKAILSGGATAGDVGSYLSSLKYKYRYRQIKSESYRDKLVDLSKAYPQHPLTYTYLADLYRNRLKDKKKAAHYYKIAALKYADQGDIRQAKYMLQRFRVMGEEMSQLKLRQGKLAESLIPLRQITRQKGSKKSLRLASHYNLIRAIPYKKRGDMAKLLEQEVKKTPHPLFYQYLYEVQKSRGKTTESVGALEKLVALDPEDTRYMYELTGLYMKAKKFKKAIPLLANLLMKYHPTKEAYHAQKVKINLAACYVGLGRPKKAVPLLKSLVSDKDTRIASLREAGDQLEKINELKLAIETYEKIADREYYTSRRFRAWRKIGDLYYKQGNLAKAREVATWIHRLGDKSSRRWAKRMLGKVKKKSKSPSGDKK